MTRYSDAEHVLRDWETFSSSINGDVIGQYMGDLILAMNGKEHRQYRNLVPHAFRVSVLERWDATLVRPVIDSLLDAIAPLGRSDLVASITSRYPVQVICGIVGVPSPITTVRASGPKTSTWGHSTMSGVWLRRPGCAVTWSPS